MELKTRLVVKDNPPHFLTLLSLLLFHVCSYCSTYSSPVWREMNETSPSYNSTLDLLLLLPVNESAAENLIVDLGQVDK